MRKRSTEDYSNIIHVKIGERCKMQFSHFRHSFEENKVGTCLVKRLVHAHNKFSILFFSERKQLTTKFYSIVLTYFQV